MERALFRSIVIVDDGGEIFAAANLALKRRGRWKPPILFRQYSDAQPYLRQAFVEAALPAAIVIPVHEDSNAPARAA